MKRAIVTTTINPPTEALMKFLKIAYVDDWHLFIVGDQKTPHEEYKKLESKGVMTYITPDDQEAMSVELSDAIGWNCIQRRNFGLIAAYNWGAEIIATIDDDNIPYDGWGRNCRVGTRAEISLFSPGMPVFDPLFMLSPEIWHRGFPIQLLPDRRPSMPRRAKREVLVQADLWDGDPDVDAVCRIAIHPEISFQQGLPDFGGTVMGPFNSQNTFLHRDCFPDYFLFPHIGRMDDIFASYYVQAKFPDSVIYAKASVFQDRNIHDLSKDLDAELIGYKHALDFVNWVQDPKHGHFDGGLQLWPEFMPRKAIDAFKLYRDCFNIESNDNKRDLSWLNNEH